MLKIVVPLSSIDNYIPLVKAGADEFFCGFISYNWLKRNNVTLPLNRREYMLDNCNICSFEELRILKKMINVYGVNVKIAFNSLYYNPIEYSSIKNLIEALQELGFNTFIISDIALIKYLRDNAVECAIHLSGECGVVNHNTVEFFEKFNIKRFIFPGKESTLNIASVIENANISNHVEFESFVLNDWCMYLGAYCNSIHCDEMPHNCHLPFRTVERKQNSDKYNNIMHVFNIRNKAIVNNELLQSKNLYSISKCRHKDYNLAILGCGLCKIYELRKSGINYLKLVGRGNSLAMIKRDLETLRKAIALLDFSNSKDEYENLIKNKILLNRCPATCFYK